MSNKININYDELSSRKAEVSKFRSNDTCIYIEDDEGFGQLFYIDDFMGLSSENIEKEFDNFSEVSKINITILILLEIS